MTWEEMYEVLQDYAGASNEALDLVFGLMGCSEETACAILYYYTGWNDFEGFLEEINE